MGQYKVPQNVEAEDHILGPLTFKQFIYALIGFGWGAISFALLRWSLPLLVIIGFPPTMLFMLLAFYTRDGQNFEQLLIALAEFFAASRKRLWVKENIAETFHVTATKPPEEMSQRNPVRVRSELEKLATLIDSRGWNQPHQYATAHAGSLPSVAHADRLVSPAPALPEPSEPHADMLDLAGSPLAQNLAALLQESSDSARQQAIGQMTGAALTSAPPLQAPAPPFTTAQPAAFAGAAAVPSVAMAPTITLPPAPATTPAGSAAHAIPRFPTLTSLAQPAPISTSGVTPAAPGDILKLATQSDDLTVSQVAAQATRVAQAPNGQVVGQYPNAG